jgi:hypothetical protein
MPSLSFGVGPSCVVFSLSCQGALLRVLKALHPLEQSFLYNMFSRHSIPCIADYHPDAVLFAVVRRLMNERIPV